jgi:hypothetical protein
MPGPVRNPTEAFQQLEAIMLRQMLQSSGAFKASSTPGAQLRTDMFVETLADAVAKAGGLGIARMLERQLGGDASPSSRESVPVDGGPSLSSPWAIALPRGGTGSIGGSIGALGTTGTTGVDDLDDPNSEAPLPEDPAAASIDDYQTGASRVGRRTVAPSVNGPHLHTDLRPDALPGHAPSGFPIGTTTRALNRYRERAEAIGAGNPASTGAAREKP